MNRRTMLERQREWLLTDVLPGYERRKDAQSIERTLGHIDDITYLLETDPPRNAPPCGWKKSYRIHDANCKRCKVGQ